MKFERFGEMKDIYLSFSYDAIKFILECMECYDSYVGMDKDKNRLFRDMKEIFEDWNNDQNIDQS